MKRHLATYRASRDYVHFEPYEGRTVEETTRAACDHALPNPWPRGWRLIEMGSARDPETCERGVRVRRRFAWRQTLPIWEGVAAKAKAAAEREIDEIAKSWGSMAPDRMAPNGWNADGCDVALESLVREDVNVKTSTAFSLPWRDLVSTDASWWPHSMRDCTIEMVFEAFRDLVRTAEGYERQCTWHKPTTHDLLSGRRTNGMHISYGYKVRPITSLADLRDRFHTALLGTAYSFYDDWRRDRGIALGGDLKVETLHHAKSHQVNVPSYGDWNGCSLADAIANMLEESRGMTLTHQLNSVHKGARYVDGFAVAVNPSGFTIYLSYGFDGSAWDEVVASTRGGEPFLATFLRAYHLMRTELIPDFADQLKARRARIDAHRKRISDWTWSKEGNRNPSHPNDVLDIIAA